VDRLLRKRGDLIRCKEIRTTNAGIPAAMAQHDNRKTVALVGVMLLTAGALGVFAGRHGLTGSDPAHGARASNAQTRALDDLHGQMQAMQDEIRDLRAGRPPSGAAHDSPLIAGSGRSRAQNTLAPQEVARKIQANVGTMDKRFDTLPEDPAWSIKAQRSVTQVISSDIPAVDGVKPENYDLACKKGMCRIAARFATLDASEQWSDLLIAGIASELPRTRVLTVQNPDGSVGLMVYAVTPGNEEQVNLKMPR
jgi:hypothetical protein